MTLTRDTLLEIQRELNRSNVPTFPDAAIFLHQLSIQGSTPVEGGLRLVVTYQVEPERIAPVDTLVSAYVDGLGLGLSLDPESWIEIDTDWTPGNAPNQLNETVTLFVPKSNGLDHSRPQHFSTGQIANAN